MAKDNTSDGKQNTEPSATDNAPNPNTTPSQGGSADDKPKHCLHACGGEVVCSKMFLIYGRLSPRVWR